MAESLSVGIVGAGAITRGVHLPVLKNIGGVRIAWIADANERLAGEMVETFALRGAVVQRADGSLPPCDIALLAVPMHARDSYMKRLAGNGSAVFAEKPFAIDLQEHRRYLDMFDRVPVACGYMRRTYANLRSLRHIVRSGWFGELRSIRYREGGRTTRTEFGSATLDLSHRLGGGVLRDLGCHGVDSISYITEASEFSVERCRIEWDGETDRHVDAQFHVLGAGGTAGRRCPVRYVVSWLLDQPNVIELEFERAWIRCGLKPEAELTIADTASARPIRLGLDEAGARSSYQAFFLEWDAVLGSLRDGGDSGFAAADRRSVWTTRLVEELYAAGGAP